LAGEGSAGRSIGYDAIQAQFELRTASVLKHIYSHDEKVPEYLTPPRHIRSTPTTLQGIFVHAVPDLFCSWTKKRIRRREKAQISV
jgi:hypothetical protein